MKRHWREFKHGRPGRRFQDRYERNRKTRSSRSKGLRFLKPVAAILLLGAGLFFCVIPGPGVPLLVLGAALLADASRRVAVGFDWLDLKLRALYALLWQCWRQASSPAKGAAVVLALALASGIAYGLFQLLKDRFG